MPSFPVRHGVVFWPSINLNAPSVPHQVIPSASPQSAKRHTQLTSPSLFNPEQHAAVSFPLFQIHDQIQFT
eukprot:17372-Eustigmatos_ZCMA.PRE.1